MIALASAWPETTGPSRRRRVLRPALCVLAAVVGWSGAAVNRPAGTPSVLWSMPAAAQAPDGQLGVRVGRHSGYGRLVLDLPFPLTYEALRSGNDVILRFDRAVGTPAAPAFGTLDPYLTGAWMADDGRALVLRLSGDWPVRTFMLTDKIVIDIHERGSSRLDQGTAPTLTQIRVLTPDQPAGTAPPPRPAVPSPGTASGARAHVPAVSATEEQSENAVTARPVTALALRTGEHDGFTRVVFDWPAGVRYNLQPLPGAVALHFDHPADIDPAALMAQPPRHISGFSIRGNSRGSMVVLGVRAGGGVKHFSLRNSIVFDVYGPGGALPDAAIRPLPPGASPPAGQSGRPLAPLRPRGGQQQPAARTGTPARAVDALAHELRRSGTPVPLPQADPTRPVAPTGGGDPDRLRQMQELLSRPDPSGAAVSSPQDDPFTPLR